MSDVRLAGGCRAIYAFDIGRGIDLAAAEARLTQSRRTTFQHKGRFPGEAVVAPPLRLTWSAPALDLGVGRTDAEVEIAAYDAGALAITWAIPFDASMEELVALSATLYGHVELTALSRRLAEEVMSALGPALDRPHLSRHIEDYVVFQSRTLFSGDASGAKRLGGGELLARERTAVARLLRAEAGALSTQEVDDALARPVSYGPHEVCLVDWLAAFLLGGDMEDERLVLELATVELLELHVLDAHLGRQIEEAYELLTRRRRIGAWTPRQRELEHVARIRADDALLHEGIDNALKLFGDDYLARLYRTASARFHFEDWDHSIQRKLGVLQTVYQSLADLAAHRRAELLEWIIIALIAVEILM